MEPPKPSWTEILFPPRASEYAELMDPLYWYIHGVVFFFTILIFAAIVFLGWRYRRRKGHQTSTAVHGSLPLEILWSVVPLLIVMTMFFWGARVFYFGRSPPADAMEILVTGKQWMWRIQHPNGRREINTLHLPLGEPVKLTMISEDVIHSFYIPAFRQKADVLPGKYTYLWFTPTREGVFHLFCAEYCGTQHSLMRGTVRVMKPEEYAAWLVGDDTTEMAATPAEAGKRLFTELGCATCHSGVRGAIGPSLENVYGHEVLLADGSRVMADDNYLRESILAPGAKIVAGYSNRMPTFAGVVNETQLSQLIAYVKSLSSASAPPAEAPAAPPPPPEAPAPAPAAPARPAGAAPIEG